MSNSFPHLSKDEQKNIETLGKEKASVNERLKECQAEILKEIVSIAKSSGANVSDEPYSQEIAQEKREGYFLNVLTQSPVFCEEYDLSQIDIEVHYPSLGWSPWGVVRCTIKISKEGKTSFVYDNGSGGANDENALEILNMVVSAFLIIKAIGDITKESPSALFHLSKFYAKTAKEFREVNTKYHTLEKLNEMRKKDEELGNFTSAFDNITSSHIASLVRNGNYGAKIVIGTADRERGQFNMELVEIEGYMDGSNRQRYEVSIGPNNWKSTSRTKLEDLLSKAIFINNKPVEQISDIVGDRSRPYRQHEKYSFSDMIEIVRPLMQAS